MQSMLNTATGVAMQQTVNNPLQPQQPVEPPSGVNNLTPYTICPNPECGSTWSQEEIEYQACDCCGYPLHHEQKARKEEEYDFSKGYYLH